MRQRPKLDLLLSFSISGIQGKENDSDLISALFKNYHNSVRPACSESTAVQVKIGLAVRQIVDLVSLSL